MIVEISGAGFHNMGAELMLIAARDEILSWDSVDDVAINFRVGTRPQRRQAGLAGVLRLDVSRRHWASRAAEMGAGISPQMLLGAMNTYKPANVDALLDASGFAFGDQWGPVPARDKARMFDTFRKRQKPIILLPQAFGPFADHDVASAARSALSAVDLIYARDPDSLAHVMSLNLTRPRIEMAPDFTNLIDPEPQPFGSPTVVVIPNARMTEMVATVTSSSYLDFLRTCTASSAGHGYRVVVMAHEAMDVRFAQELASERSDDVTVMKIDDPVRAKALVRDASLVISSRYHGLVNALSQCVPAIGTSWSHKYEHLFADYRCEDGLWAIDDPERIEARLSAWLSESSLNQRSQALEEPAQSMKDQTAKMWAGVRDLLSGR